MKQHFFRKTQKSHLHWLGTLIVVWTLAVTMVIAVSAAETSTFNVFQLSASSSGEVEVSVTETGWSIKAYGTDGSCGSTSTQTVTFTIKNTAAQGVSFNITTTGMGTNDSSASKTLEASGTTSLEYTATSGKGSSAYTEITISFANIELESTGATVDTVFEVQSGGTLYVDGTALTESSTHTNSDDYTYILKAEPASGYKLFGWMCSSTGALDITGNTEISYIGKTANTIWPLFIKESSAVYYIKDANPRIYYGFFDDAITAAGTSGTIVLYQSGTMYGTNSSNFTLSGQTFLLPYTATNLSIATSTSTDDSGSCNSTYQYANATFTSDQYDNSSTSDNSVEGVMEYNTGVYLTLTIPSGATLNVNSGSKLVVGGTIVSGTVMTGGICGATASGHSNIQLSGTINVNSGGILSCCGYIYGGGTLNVASSGSVYQPFIVTDHHDGHFVANSKDANYFPFARYTMLNIQSKIVMTSGATMYGYIDVFTQKTSVSIYTVQSRHNVDCQKVIGSGNDSALFLLNSGKLTLTYYPSKTVKVSSSTDNNTFGYYQNIGKTTLEFNGDAALGSITVGVYVPVLGEQSMASGDSTFPIPYNYDIKQVSGTFTLGKAMSILPGASFTVDTGAGLTIASGGSLAIYDGLRDYATTASSVTAGSSWPRYHYPSTGDLQSYGFSGTGDLIVNGTLTVASGGTLGGIVQTDGTTGTIAMKSGSSNSLTAVFGIIHEGQSLFSIQATNPCVGKTTHALTAQVYFANGLTTLTAGNTYTVVGNDINSLATYTYNVYTTKSDTSNYTTETQTLNKSIIGNWCISGSHSYTTTVVAPTCTANGYTKHTCSVCGHSYTDTPTETTNHTYNSVVIDPTCTAQGYTRYTCGDCGNTYDSDTVAATGHSAVTDAAVAATCKNTGLTEGSHCSVCNEVLVAQKVVEKLPHTEVVDAAVPPTCTSTGLTEGKHCSVCGEIIIKQEKQPALGHTEVIDEAVDATCKAPGKTLGSHCSVCNTVLVAQEEIPQLAHTEVVVAGKAATCTETGLTEGKKCSVCGTVTLAQTVIETIDHIPETVPGSAATCTNPGLTDGSKCSVCGTTLTAQEEIPATGHSEKVLPGHAATCTEPGLTDGKQCSVCQIITEKQAEIPALGHKWENGVCTVCGTTCNHNFGTDGICTICGLNCTHNYEAAVTAPTCTEQGYTTYTCSICQNTYVNDLVDAKGHVWNAATCTAPKTCSVCGAKDGEANGHSYSAVVTAPTCTAQGYTTHTCPACGDSYIDTYIDATGHTNGTAVKENEEGNTCIGTSYDSVVYCTVCSAELSRTTFESTGQGHQYTDEVTPPTCTEQGFTTHTCSVCGHVSKDTPTPATGHSYSETWSVTKPATYNTPAEKSSKCDNCDAAQTRTINSAAVDGAEYLTLSEALGKAGEGATVTLLTDIDGEITVSQVVTIAKAGFTADISAGKGYTYTESGTTVIIGKAQLSIYATNIKAGDSLDLYFYIQKADLSGTDYKAVINRTKAGVATEPVEIPYAEWTDYGSYKRFYYDGIAAKEMTDEVTVTICDTQGNPLSSATTETIQGYALRVLSRTTDAELRTALVDMLNYGAAAQKKLDNYNGKDLANANTESYQVYATQEDVECREEPKDDNVNLKSASVSVKSNLYYTFYFAGIDNTMSATATYTDHYGNEKTVSIPGSEFHAHTDTDGSTLWGVDVKGLAIADGRQQITCEVMDENNTVIAKGIGSVQGYVATAANQGENAAVYGMLMKFVDSAYAYFH